MRDYELLYIIKPEVAEDAIDGIVEKFNGILVKEGAAAFFSSLHPFIIELISCLTFV